MCVIGIATTSGVAVDMTSTRHNTASPKAANEAALLVVVSNALAANTYYHKHPLSNPQSACEKASIGYVMTASLAFVVVSPSSSLASTLGCDGITLLDCRMMRLEQD